MNKAIKWTLVAIGLAVVSNVIKESVKASREVDARIQFESSCEKQAKAGGNIPTHKIKGLCSCATEKTAKQLGQARFSTLLKKGVDAPESDRLILSASLIACAAE